MSIDWHLVSSTKVWDCQSGREVEGVWGVSCVHIGVCGITTPVLEALLQKFGFTSPGNSFIMWMTTDQHLIWNVCSSCLTLHILIILEKYFSIAIIFRNMTCIYVFGFHLTDLDIDRFIWRNTTSEEMNSPLRADTSLPQCLDRHRGVEGILRRNLTSCQGTRACWNRLDTTWPWWATPDERGRNIINKDSRVTH